MDQTSHSRSAPQEKLRRSQEILRWARRVLSKSDLPQRVRERFEAVKRSAIVAVRVRKALLSSPRPNPPRPANKPSSPVPSE